MAIPHGSRARVWFNSLDASAYLHSATLDASTATGDATTFATAPNKVYTVGQKDRQFSAEGYYDPGQTTLEGALGVDTGVLTFCPGGAGAIGDLAWLSTLIGIDYAPSDNIGDTVAFAWSGQTTGPTAFGYVLHRLLEDTNTTTGASRDDGAATSTGWVAHVHCTLVDGGSWVIKLQDSADNSSWGDVTGGAFTALTAAGSQRLVSAAGATLRRYVRYVATRTGGTTGDGITFALGIARTYTV